MFISNTIHLNSKDDNTISSETHKDTDIRLGLLLQRIRRKHSRTTTITSVLQQPHLRPSSRSHSRSALLLKLHSRLAFHRHRHRLQRQQRLLRTIGTIIIQKCYGLSRRVVTVMDVSHLLLLPKAMMAPAIMGTSEFI